MLEEKESASVGTIQGSTSCTGQLLSVHSAPCRNHADKKFTNPTQFEKVVMQREELTVNSGGIPGLCNQTQLHILPYNNHFRQLPRRGKNSFPCIFLTSFWLRRLASLIWAIGGVVYPSCRLLHLLNHNCTTTFTFAFSSFCLLDWLFIGCWLGN